MFQTLLDFVFPRRSLTGEEGQYITAEEFLQLKSFPIIEEAHVLRGRGIHNLDAIRAGCSYHHSPLLKKAIHTWKYGRVQGLGQHFAKLLLSAPLPNVPSDTVLCPVPLHWSRNFQRGFNQSDILAAAVSRAKGLPVKQLLSRSRPTGFQSHRSRAERLVSVENAFVCREPAPRCVILIDDLATTGATLDSCARALKESGARHIEAWVVAHG